jgi:hypothetical protein
MYRPPKRYPPEYAAIAAHAFSDANVPALVRQRAAVVLERIARGAGATNWYVLEGLDDLDMLCRLVRPGSLVSFYFDGRIAETRLDDSAREQLSAIALSDHGAVIALRAKGIELDADFPGTRRELDHWLEEMGNPERGFVGPYPGHDSDGIDAVTLTLPDLDGTVRAHPH